MNVTSRFYDTIMDNIVYLLGLLLTIFLIHNLNELTPAECLLLIGSTLLIVMSLSSEWGTYRVRKKAERYSEDISLQKLLQDATVFHLGLERLWLDFILDEGIFSNLPIRKPIRLLVNDDQYKALFIISPTTNRFVVVNLGNSSIPVKIKNTITSNGYFCEGEKDFKDLIEGNGRYSSRDPNAVITLYSLIETTA